MVTAFNTTSSAGAVGPPTTTVLIAGDDTEAVFADVVTAGGLTAIDAGSLPADRGRSGGRGKQTRDLEAIG